MITPGATDDQKKQEIERFEEMLQRLREQFKNDETYLSGTDSMCALDILFHSDVSAIVCMYSIRERLDEKKYPELSKWMTEMAKNEFISDNISKMKEVISAKRMYGDFLKA